MLTILSLPADYPDNIGDSSYLIRRPARLPCRVIYQLHVSSHLISGGILAERRHPTVARSADEPQHPRSEGTNPDANPVRRAGSCLSVLELVVLPWKAYPCPRAPVVPDKTNYLDRFFQSLDGLARLSPCSAVRLDRVPVRACAYS